MFLNATSIKEIVCVFLSSVGDRTCLRNNSCYRGRVCRLSVIQRHVTSNFVSEAKFVGSPLNWLNILWSHPYEIGLIKISRAQWISWLDRRVVRCWTCTGVVVIRLNPFDYNWIFVNKFNLFRTKFKRENFSSIARKLVRKERRSFERLWNKQMRKWRTLIPKIPF